jgi:PIN domain nuclease of toxin-antitoxin system
LTLKFNIHKLAYSPQELAEGAKELNLSRMPLRDKHILYTSDIKLSHKDPFDSLLIAQSEAEDCLFLTADSKLLSSGYHTFKC